MARIVEVLARGTATRVALIFAAVCVALVFRSAHRGSADGSQGASAGPLAEFALPLDQRLRFEGRVLSRLDAGPYVYLELERPDGQRSWVVSLRSSSAVRDRAPHVQVLAVGHAAHFRSQRLGRVFDDLYFAVVRAA